MIELGSTFMRLYMLLFEACFLPAYPSCEWFVFPDTLQPLVICRKTDPQWLRNLHEHKKIPVVEYECKPMTKSP